MVNLMEEKDFFEEYKVMLLLNGKKVRIFSFQEAKDKYLAYIHYNKLSESTLKKKDGNIMVDKEILAVFSFNGRLWSTADENEIIWS